MIDSRPEIGAFGQHLGIEIAEWRDGHATLRLAVRPSFLNRSGILHGGVLTTLIDTAGGYAGTYCAVPGHVRRAFTLSMTTQFTGRASAGVLHAEAARKAGGRRIFFAEIEVFGDDGELLAFGSANYRLLAGHETPNGVPVENPR